MDFPDEITLYKSGGSMNNPETLRVVEWQDDNTVRVEGHSGFRGLITIKGESSEPTVVDNQEFAWRDEYQAAREKIKDMGLGNDIDLTSSHETLIDFIEANQ